MKERTPQRKLSGSAGSALACFASCSERRSAKTARFSSSVLKESAWLIWKLK